jgi:hypothetical protein
MNKIFAVLVVGTGITFGLVSCNSDQIAPTDSNTESARVEAVSKQDVSVIDGHLRFANSKALMKTLTDLNDRGRSEAWEKKYSGYKSMRAAYNELIKYDIGKALTDGSISAYEGSYSVTVEKDGQKSYDRAIVDQALATIVNSQGITQVGDSLYRINERWVVALPVQYKSEISNEQPVHGVQRAVVHKVLSVSQSPNARLLSDHDQNYIEYHPDGLKLRRFRTLGWSTNYWVSQQYWSAGYRVWHQRNNWYGWGGEPADYIRVWAKVTINGQLRYYPGGVVPSQGSDQGYGVEEIQFRYSEGWTSASVGRCGVEFSWNGTGNGDNGGQKIYKGYTGNWEEDI